MAIRLILFILIVPFYCFGQYSTAEIDSLLIKENSVLAKTYSAEKLVIWNKNLIDISHKKGYERGEVLGYINIASIYWMNTQYRESLRFLAIAEEYAKKMNDAYIYGRFYLELAQIYFQMGLSDIAIRYCNTAISYLSKVNSGGRDNKILQYAYICRAAYYYHNDPKESLYSLRKAGSYYPTPLNRCNMARYYLDKGHNMDSARYYLEQALTLVKSPEFQSDNYQKASVLMANGEILSETGNLKRGIESLRQALELSETVSYIQLKLEICRSLKNAYEKIGDTDNELAISKRFNTLQDSLETKQNSGIALSLDNILGDNTKEKQIAKNRQRYLIIVGGVALVFLFATFYILRHYRRKILVNKAILREKEQENQELSKLAQTNFDKLMDMAKDNNPEFLVLFQNSYPEFCEKLNILDPQMNHETLKFCALLKLNFSTKEIAKYTFLEVRSVQTKKSRLRKQLNIPSDIDLNIFMINLAD